MTKADTAATLFAGHRIMVVMTVDDAAAAVGAARAIASAGLKLVEVVMRTPRALECLRAVRREAPDLIVGAGTVRTPRDLEDAVAVGAQFAISPGTTPLLLDAAEDFDIPFVPAIATPSELLAACERGHRLCKLFPANTLGVATLRALAGPFADVHFCATGGVTPDNAREFLAEPNVMAVGVSWVTPADALRSGDFERIGKLAAQAAAL